MRASGSCRGEFDGVERRHDQTRDIWASDDVRGAMEEFSGNMDHHRRALADEMEDVGKKLEATVTAFRDADRKLREELEKNLRGGPA